MVSEKNQRDYAQVQWCAISKHLLLFGCLREVCEGERKVVCHDYSLTGTLPEMSQVLRPPPFVNEPETATQRMSLAGTPSWAYSYLVWRLKSERKRICVSAKGQASINIRRAISWFFIRKLPTIPHITARRVSLSPARDDHSLAIKSKLLIGVR